MQHPIDKRPTWWLLYGMGAMLVGLVVVIEASVASVATRLFLELGTVVAMSLLMLGWLRANRARIALAELYLTTNRANRVTEKRKEVTANGRQADSTETGAAERWAAQA